MTERERERVREMERERVGGSVEREKALTVLLEVPICDEYKIQI